MTNRVPGVWIHFAVCLWCVVFAAPHIWWAFGSPFGFPGGLESHQLMMSSRWRYIYDLIVILMSILGVIVALGLRHPSNNAKTRWALQTMAWIAFTILTLRGVAGLVVDRTSDLIWWPLFLVGGLLFGALAIRSRSVHVAE